MNKTLESNTTYWKNVYNAPNVESFLFRPYGRIFKTEFGLDGSKHEKVLDFGCGEGAGARFFHQKGFDVYGVDINESSITSVKQLLPDIENHFQMIDPEPTQTDMFFDGDFDLVISIQVLYYLNDTQLKARLKSLYNMMKPGGYIYASMMGSKCWYYDHSTPGEDGMRSVSLKTKTYSIDNYYVNFIETQEEMLDKFSLFKKIHYRVL